MVPFLGLLLAWHAPGRPPVVPSGRRAAAAPRARAPSMRTAFELKVDLGDGAGTVRAQFDPLFSLSELVTVRYAVPLELDMSPEQGMFRVTRSGRGLQVGDVLRACSTFSDGMRMREVDMMLGMIGGGATVSKCLFLADGQRPDKVVDALTANTGDRTSDVVLVVERPLPRRDT